MQGRKQRKRKVEIEVGFTLTPPSIKEVSDDVDSVENWETSEWGLILAKEEDYESFCPRQKKKTQKSPTHKLLSSYVKQKKDRRREMRQSHYLNQKVNANKRLERKKIKRMSELEPLSRSRKTEGHSKRKPQTKLERRKHVLRRDNLPKGVSEKLIELQNRELIPEDYELLLTLDETVKTTKTVERSVVDGLRQSTVKEKSKGELCTICMEAYKRGQKLTILTCNHRFHSSCIEHWLLAASDKCPLDGLAVA